MEEVLRVLRGFALVVVLAGGSECPAGDNPGKAALDLQVRLFDAIAAANPACEDTVAAIRKLTSAQQEERLAALEERNAQNPLISALIDSLLATEAYQLYYRQFRNVTPEIHRRIFLALPYQAISAPADLGTTQLELFQHRSQLATLVGKIAEADVGRAVTIARLWVPPTASTSVPPTYYFADGNGDAFALDGAVGFDLYGVVLSKRAPSDRYEGLEEMSPGRIEATLAHEFQHIFAQPYLYPSSRRFDRWQDRWEDIIVRRIVSEGTAMQCDPPSGFKKAVMEDSIVVGYWMREFERVIGEIRRSEISEDSVQAWLDRNYQETAWQLLDEYVQRTYPESEWAVMRSTHAGERPSGIYTMGWWMLSHVIAAGGREQAIELLSTPHDLFTLYNAAAERDRLRIRL